MCVPLCVVLTRVACFLDVTAGSNLATAVCYITGTTAGPNVAGVVEFVEDLDGNLMITLNVTGLADGNHTFHVHEFGDVSSPTAAAAGGHFIGTCNSCRPGSSGWWCLGLAESERACSERGVQLAVFFS